MQKDREKDRIRERLTDREAETYIHSTHRQREVKRGDRETKRKRDRERKGVCHTACTQTYYEYIL